MLGLGIGEAAAGIAMIRASVSFIKENISTAKDIGEIAEHIDNLFVGQSKINKQSKMAPGQFSIGAIARETVDAKLAAASARMAAPRDRRTVGWSVGPAGLGGPLIHNVL